MPQGDKSAYTNKQKRMAAHIEQSYQARGLTREESEARAWATVNKVTGGGRKSGSGRARPKFANGRKTTSRSRSRPRSAKRS